MMPGWIESQYEAPGTRYVATYVDLRDGVQRTITFRTEDGALDGARGLLDAAIGRRSYTLLGIAREDGGPLSLEREVPYCGSCGGDLVGDYCARCTSWDYESEGA